MVQRVALLVWIISMNLVLSAQQHPFIQYTTRDGLSQSQVRCITQDADGYLWFGTVGGASRFDGLEFRNFAMRQGLPDPQVLDMLALEDGTIWFATGSGLARFAGDTMQAIPLPKPAQAARVNALGLSKDGNLLAAVQGHGLFQQNAETFRAMDFKGLPNSVAIRDIEPGPAGSLLLATNEGLYSIADDQATEISLLPGTSLSVSSVAMNSGGELWVSTFGDGLFCVKPNGGIRNFDDVSGLLQNNIRHVEVDSRERVWASTKFGMNLIEDEEVRSFTIYRGMPNDNIYCTFEDAEGSIWLGTDGAGVLKYSGDRFVTYTTLDGLCSDLIMSIVEDDRGDLWLGTYGNGVCRLDGMAMINTLDGIPNNTIWSGLHAGDGILYFGTSDGIAKLRHGMAMEFDGRGLLDDIRVFSLVMDEQNRIWCGTRNGAVLIGSEGEIRDLRIPVRSVRSIVHASGVTYLGSASGVVRISSTDTTLINEKDGLSDANVYCMALDDEQRLWVGTANGLNCLTDTGISTFRLAEDYGSNYINLINQTSGSTLSIGTNNGLYIVDAEALLAGERAAHFTEADGLRTGEFNLNSTYTDPQGRDWFGTTGGLLLHDPSRIDEAERVHVPIMRIKGIRSFLKENDWSSSANGVHQRTGLPIDLRITPDKNYLTFDYVGINHTEPEKVEYRYRLEGHDEDWLPATKARFASYTNLSHGDYTFMVKSRVPGSSWSESASFSFIVLKPFWLTWWFLLLGLLFVILLAFAVLKIRKRQRASSEKTKQLMLRSRMLQLEQQALNANMNRHFVFNALNSIQFYINKQEKESANKYLTSFAKLIRKNLDNSQSDTTTLAEELERLKLYLELEHMRFSDKFEYELEIAPGLDLISVPIPAMMLQPYVENSIWHGILPSERHGKVEIRVRGVQEQRVQVSIHDNGIGINESLSRKKKGDHISKGIEITKGRADVLRRLELSDIRINGPQQVTDSAGVAIGTTVTIELPISTVPR